MTEQLLQRGKTMRITRRSSNDVHNYGKLATSGNRRSMLTLDGLKHDGNGGGQGIHVIGRSMVVVE